MKACDIDGCTAKAHARGWCSLHYQRWKRLGKTAAHAPKYATPEESFIARVAWDGEHLIWTGATGNGYGRIRVDGRLVGVHRWAYEREHGPIPHGMFIDHACYTPLCVNVDHLRLASPAQNAQNLSGPRTGRTLPRGVVRAGRKYVAKVGNAGRLLHFGTFDTIEEAAAASATARKEMFGEFAGA